MASEQADAGRRGGLLAGKVALVTGAARGQGRSHAVRLAREGAAVIAVDICRQIESVPYPMSTEEDLEETARQVKAYGATVVTAVADVRDHTELKRAVDAGVAELGRLDVIVANAGIMAPVRPGVPAQDLGRYSVRGNAILPTNTATPMLLNEATYRLFRADLEHPALDDAREPMASMNLLPVAYIDPADVSEAVLWLASDLSRYVTGVALPVDAGASLK
jgi:NAD(P)-dependent dehydrogenase (short-subunit alcohol dehydrogenase family)